MPLAGELGDGWEQIGTKQKVNWQENSRASLHRFSGFCACAYPSSGTLCSDRWTAVLFRPSKPIFSPTRTNNPRHSPVNVARDEELHTKTKPSPLDEAKPSKEPS